MLLPSILKVRDSVARKSDEVSTLLERAYPKRWSKNWREMKNSIVAVLEILTKSTKIGY